ncbi:MAG TPA: hypothetical protein VN380_00305 [Thermoanaerobaculia bacterium]|jgi:hypothetical protein|nr:hypothetical protein [Thermoanaerobaculia bacterium]
MTGIPAGETAYIRGEDGNAVLSYRSFASAVGIIAALLSAVVFAAGVMGMLFLLIMEQRPLPAIAALMLSAVFAALIVMLIPATNVTIFDAGAPAITIVQQPGLSFPSVTYVVSTPDGNPVARITSSFLSRFGRNRWSLNCADDFLARGEAVEESFGRALVRKAFGTFAPAYQSNIRITWMGEDAGWIIRRPGADGHADVLDLNPTTTLDRRVAVALALLVLGSEP